MIVCVAAESVDTKTCTTYLRRYNNLKPSRINETMPFPLTAFFQGVRRQQQREEKLKKDSDSSST